MRLVVINRLICVSLNCYSALQSLLLVIFAIKFLCKKGTLGKLVCLNGHGQSHVCIEMLH